MARSLVAQPFLTLDAYRKLLNIPLWRFNGIDNPNERASGCDMCWPQWMRDRLALALYDAELMIANELGYYIGPRFLTDYDLPYTDFVMLKSGYVVEAGRQKLTKITPLSFDFTGDPAVIEIKKEDLPDGVTGLKIVETRTDIEIIPDSIAENATSYTVHISQAKLLPWDVLSAQSTCVDYDAEFSGYLNMSDLTVYRESIDKTSQATVVYRTVCSQCFDATVNACVYIADGEIGKVSVIPNASIPNSATAIIRSIDYYAGTTGVAGWENAIISLAHTLMDVEPCGCSLFDARWQRDTRIPLVLTSERINCPFGQMDGAWRAWKWVLQNRHGVAVML